MFAWLQFLRAGIAYLIGLLTLTVERDRDTQERKHFPGEPFQVKYFPGN